MDDAMFKKACERWHADFSTAEKTGDVHRAEELERHVVGFVQQWDQHVKKLRIQVYEANRELERLRLEELSAMRRMRLLKKMAAFMGKRKQAINSKAEESTHAGISTDKTGGSGLDS